MTTPITRRQAIQGITVAGAALLLRIDSDAQGQPLTIAGQPVELRVTSISPITVRVSILPKGATDADLNRDGGLVPLAEQRRTVAGSAPLKVGAITMRPISLMLSSGTSTFLRLRQRSTPELVA